MVHRAAFIVFWLCKFVFCEHPHYSIKLAYFPMAIKIFAGVSLPLGPLFLGYLYTQLDELHIDEIMGKFVEWSLHRCIVPSFLVLLQIFSKGMIL